jgi:Methyltransferase FkbM domain
MSPSKAQEGDLIGRFREIISDPLNLLIERVPMAGVVQGNEVFLHNGNRVPFSGDAAYYGAFSQILIINRGVHEPLEEYVFQEVIKKLREDPVMIELGAYWGHYSMWLKKSRPHATQILVEPNPVGLAAGKGNFQRNGFEGEFINALAAKGQFEIDRFFERRNLGRLDVLHVDIQGFEIQMLDAARATLAGKKIDYLFISTHSQKLHGDVVKTLEGHGYRVEVSSDYDNDTTSFDGFVLASSPNAKQIFRDFVPFGRTKIVESPVDRTISAVLAMRNAAA